MATSSAPAPEPPGSPPVRRKRRSFSEQFKTDAVELYLKTGRPIRQIADELDIGESNLSNWIAKHRAATTPTNDQLSELRDELDATRKALREATEERELLKRTVAFWVKESPS